MYSAVFSDSEKFSSALNSIHISPVMWETGPEHQALGAKATQLGKFHYYNNSTYLFRTKESKIFNAVHDTQTLSHWKIYHPVQKPD